MRCTIIDSRDASESPFVSNSCTSIPRESRSGMFAGTGYIAGPTYFTEAGEAKRGRGWKKKGERVEEERV